MLTVYMGSIGEESSSPTNPRCRLVMQDLFVSIARLADGTLVLMWLQTQSRGALALSSRVNVSRRSRNATADRWDSAHASIYSYFGAREENALPPVSPDLNVIENAWARLKGRTRELIADRPPRIRDELWDHVLDAWEEIAQDLRIFSEARRFHG